MMSSFAPQPLPTAQFVCALETARTQSLVGKNIALARELHSPDYQLITPGGKVFNRDQYLAEVEAGTLEYVKWEIAQAHVRASPGMAIVRYLATLEFPSGKTVRCWHTDSYEVRGQCWQAVWSQATAIPSSA